MFKISYFWIGIFIIVFIICIALLIFAPKSTNYYSVDTYPILKYINENNMNIIKEEFESIKKSDDWVLWPDKEHVNGNYEIYPMYMFGTINKKRKETCSNTYALIQNTPNIKSCVFLRVNPNSSINKNKGWSELSNKTLCCIFILESLAHPKVEKCGIWVNGESKKLTKNKLIIFDSSKEHSIYNKMDEPVYILLLDIERPDKLPDGTSTREYTDEIYDFIQLLLTD